MTGTGFDVRWTPEHGQPRTVVFEPREKGWLRAEFEWTGSKWRPVGHERVTEVALFDEDCDLGAPARDTLTDTDEDSKGSGDDD